MRPLPWREPVITASRAFRLRPACHGYCGRCRVHCDFVTVKELIKARGVPGSRARWFRGPSLATPWASDGGALSASRTRGRPAQARA
eukprot:598868-Pyramimonas_sp.AAC.1